MSTVPTKAKAQTPQQRMASRRERLRAQGLRPVQHWVPDLRDPTVVADLKRQAKLMAKHPQNAELDDWLDKAIDWDEWR
jgi:hypothetical protein